jgi:hypothetical protein
MTARLPFTQSQVRRAIAAARKAGLRVVGIRPDGMVIVDDGETSLYRPPDAPGVSSKWEDCP